MEAQSQASTPSCLPTDDELTAIVRRAEQGDSDVLPELRRLLDGYPEIWHNHGDLALHATSAWLDLVAGENLVQRECLERKLAELRDGVAGGAASPLERLLAERVMIGWLQAWYADYACARLRARNPGLAALNAAEKRQGSAQHRYLQAVKVLATVRKLCKPALSPYDLARCPTPETAGAANGSAAWPHRTRPTAQSFN